MIKRIFSLITTLVMIISLTGVLPTVNASASDAAVSYKSFNKTYYSDSGKQICKITLKRPIIKGNKKSYKKINNYLKKIQSEYVSNILNYAKDIAPDSESYHVRSILKLTYNKGNIVSIKETYDDYTGGAHGINLTKGYTFNLKTGKRINISKVSKYKTKIKSKIVSKFRRKIEAYPDNYFEDALQTVKNQRLKDYNYYLKDSYMYVIFNPYEIAPYAGGVQKIRIKLR